MPQIGPLEILVVSVVALIVFGPQRLPEIARSVGKAINEFKRQASDIKSEFQSEMDMSAGEPTAQPPARQEPLPDAPPDVPLAESSPGVDVPRSADEPADET